MGQPFANNPTDRPATCCVRDGGDVGAGERGGHAAGGWFSASPAIPLNRNATHHVGGPHATLRDGAYRCTRTPVHMCAHACTHSCTCMREHRHTIRGTNRVSVCATEPSPWWAAQSGICSLNRWVGRCDWADPQTHPPPGWTPCAVHTPTLGVAEDRDGLGSEALVSQG